MAKHPNRHFGQRQTKCQQVQEELNTIEQGNANLNRNERASPHTSQNVHYQNDKGQQVLVRMWRRGKGRMLLMGMQTGTATMVNSVDIPAETENGTTI